MFQFHTGSIDTTIMKSSNKTVKRPQGRPPGTRDSRATGTGIVWEIIEARGITKVQMAAEMGVSVPSVETYTRTGTQPVKPTPRASLLTAALLIPESHQSRTIKAWIDSEREYWRNIAPPGVFI
jgi:hypothetical protein